MSESVAERPETPERAAREHLVCFADGAGTAHRERHVSLGAAVSRVEQLANDHGVQETELFALHPVRLARQQRWHVAVEPSSPEFDAALDAAMTAAISTAVPDTAVPDTAVPDAAVHDTAVPYTAAYLDAVDAEVVEQSFYATGTESAPTPPPPPSAPALPADASLMADAAAGPSSGRHHHVLPPAPRGRGLGFFVH